MCFTNKYRKSKKKSKQKYIKSNKIIPIQIKNDETKTILDELIYCNGCKKHHRSDEFKLSCNECDKLFHCQVAGRCQGIHCLINMGNGLEYRYGYCLNCVDLKLNINNNNDDKCLCKNCQKYI